MRVAMLLVGFLSMALVPTSADQALAKANPIEKVIELLSNLQAKVVSEGEDAQKLYEEFAEWCEDEAKQKQFEIKTGEAQKEELEATIAKANADIEGAEAAIGELSEGIATNEKDLADAKAIRKKENDDLKAEQPAADAAEDAEEEAALGAPDPAVYKGHSHGIIQVMEDMLAKAEDQLADARKKEMNAQHNFELLEQSLKDEIENQNKKLANQKDIKASAEETKATAEGDLAVTVKDLEEDKAALASLHQECMTKAQEFEAATKSRGEG